MNLLEVPYKVIISMPQASDRRWLLHEKLCSFGYMDVECVHPVPVEEIDLAQYPNLPKEALPYISQILTIKNVLLDAKQKGQKSIWILEDDAVFHPEFNDHVRRLRVPNNWCFLYLGGAYYEKVIRINSAIVRPEKILDLHSIVISAKVYDVVIRQLDAVLKDRSRNEVFADVSFAALHKKYPAYLCRPNLVWQAAHYSDLKGRHYSNYAPDGEQWHRPTSPPMSAVFTFCTKDRDDWESRDNAPIINAYMQAAYAAQAHFSRTVLYTDSLGKKVLKDVYFDEVLVTLDAFAAAPHTACAAKLDTIARQTESFIHIDPDIVIEKEIVTEDYDLIVAPLGISAQDQQKACDLIRALEWKPGFVKEILGNRQRVEANSLGIIGGKDTKFLNWFATTALEVLRKMENAAFFANPGKEANASRNAIEACFLSVAATHRGKQFNCLREGSAYSRHEIKAGARPSAKPKTLAKKDKNGVNPEPHGEVHPKSDSTYIQYAKQGQGWFIDLHQDDCNYIIAHDKDEGENFAGKVSLELGISCKIKVIKGNSAPAKAKTNRVVAGNDELLRETILGICEEVKKKNTGQFLLLRPGIEFNANIQELLYRIVVPYDWQFVYLGGKAVGDQQWVGRGLAKSNDITGFEAVLVHRAMLDEVVKVFLQPIGRGENCESRFNQLHKIYPAYVCQPTLAMKAAAYNNGSKVLAAV